MPLDEAQPLATADRVPLCVALGRGGVLVEGGPQMEQIALIIVGREVVALSDAQSGSCTRAAPPAHYYPSRIDTSQ